MNVNSSNIANANTFGGDPNFVLASSPGTSAQNLVYTPNAGTALSNTGTGSGSFMQTMGQGLSNVGQKVVSKLTNPDTLANAVLQVGGAVASEAMVGTPENPEEQQALETYKAELLALKEKDEAAFNQKMDAAKAHMVQAGYYDPNYLGLQSANQAAIVGARKLRDFEKSAALRSGGLSQGERRRAALTGGLNISSAYDQGFGQGISLQNQGLTTATNLIPTAGLGGVNAASNYLSLASTSAQNARDAAQKQKDNIMNMFGKFNTASGNTKKEDEDIEEKAEDQNESSGGLPALPVWKNVVTNEA